jgi:4-hydroxybenzoate polyprenyltransferase
VAQVKDFFSLVKFSHTVFALPFALIGFFLAVGNGHPFSMLLLGKVLLCMVLARTAAMAFNRYADRRIDSVNERTRRREIPAGVISARAALALVIACSLLFMAASWSINSMCFALSPVSLAVILGYSYTKRFTALCHLVLGAGLALAPIGAYLAVAAQFDVVPVLFSCCVFFWVSGFDIIYALQDEAFDRQHHLHSIPARLGKPKALSVSNLLHVVSAACIVAAGFLGGFHLLYWAGCLVFIVLLAYQHHLVRPDDLSRVNVAFFTTNGIASVVFSVFVILDLYFSA